MVVRKLRTKPQLVDYEMQKALENNRNNFYNKSYRQKKRT